MILCFIFKYIYMYIDLYIDLYIIATMYVIVPGLYYVEGSE